MGLIADPNAVVAAAAVEGDDAKVESINAKLASRKAV